MTTLIIVVLASLLGIAYYLGQRHALSRRQASFAQRRSWVPIRSAEHVCSDTYAPLKNGGGFRGHYPITPSPEARAFAIDISHELEVNKRKGDWRDVPAEACLQELHLHVEKLRKAMDRGSLAEVREYAADCGAIAMMLSFNSGAIGQERRYPSASYDGGYGADEYTQALAEYKDSGRTL